MFEKLFQNAMAYAARLLFVASLVMFFWALLFAFQEFASEKGENMSGWGGDQWNWFDSLLVIFTSAFDPAAKLFFGAAVMHLLEERLRR